MAEGIFGSLFGATGGGGAAPAAPTITLVRSDTTVTATFDGDAGVTNELRYRAVGDTAWTDGGSRSGDGDVAVAGLTEGITYEFVGFSSNANGNSEPAVAGLVAIPTDVTGLFDAAMAEADEAAMVTMGETVTVHISDVDTRSVLAIVHRQARTGIGGVSKGRQEPVQITLRNDGTNGLTPVEVNRGTMKITFPYRKGGATVKKNIKAVVSQNAGFITVKVG